MAISASMENAVGAAAGGSGPSGGSGRGKKKWMPAKNLMAERRRRKKLNNHLYMLHLVVPMPKISKVEVRNREEHAVNFHMLCARRPSILLSTMMALDSLGLDIKQAVVISCFNGFAMDVFGAERCADGPGMVPEKIKAVLMHTASLHSAM